MERQPLSKARLKFFRALQQKKRRRESGLYLAEGRKLLLEAAASEVTIAAVVAQTGFELPPGLPPNAELFEASEIQLRALSTLQASEGVVSVLRKPEPAPLVLQAPAFLLYGVNDPGNLGALIRAADWFGFPAVYCDEKTAECWNPKAVRASMGGVFRVNVEYPEDFVGFLRENRARIAGAGAGGAPITEGIFAARDLILLGGEANGFEGLPEDVKQALPTVAVPRYGGAESLNVAVAGGILAYALRNSRT